MRLFSEQLNKFRAFWTLSHLVVTFQRVSMVTNREMPTFVGHKLHRSGADKKKV